MTDLPGFLAYVVLVPVCILLGLLLYALLPRAK